MQWVTLVKVHWWTTTVPMFNEFYNIFPWFSLYKNLVIIFYLSMKIISYGHKSFLYDKSKLSYCHIKLQIIWGLNKTFDNFWGCLVLFDGRLYVIWQGYVPSQKSYDPEPPQKNFKKIWKDFFSSFWNEALTGSGNLT